MMYLKARKYSVCPLCGGAIHPGDFIRMAGGCHHAVCPRKSDRKAMPVRPAAPAVVAADSWESGLLKAAMAFKAARKGAAA
jgi:hypothetical protein